MKPTTLQKHDCDRCGFTYKKDALRRQRGMLLCGNCRDNLKRIAKPKPRWMSPRDNSLTTTPVNTPTVFTISAATGISFLGQSREYDHEGSRRHFYMQVISDGGAIDLTTFPNIVTGLQGDVLTLTGTSDTDTIKLNDGGTTHLHRSLDFVLTKGDSITLVYNASAITTGGWGVDPWGSSDWGTPPIGWVECSRNKGGV